jgi:hypothetical protein
MEHIDRPAHVQALSEPAGASRPRAEAKALRRMTRPERRDGITGHRGRRRHLGQRAAVRPPEPEGAVALARNLVARLVHRPVMPATEQCQVRERRRAPLRPVAEVMPLPDADPAAREAEEARSGGVEVRGQLGDRVAEPVQLCGGMLTGKRSW